ncbi:hypothetical protein Ciccas_003222 [Cichlidogyrus casuarinus]|uniref:Uncharacterized protein n=1 Tax=Cichlidogyrus casuarinus TaxID=1844966 RepID=A0ABD2QEY8_9PLAT
MDSLTVEALCYAKEAGIDLLCNSEQLDRRCAELRRGILTLRHNLKSGEFVLKSDRDELWQKLEPLDRLIEELEERQDKFQKQIDTAQRVVEILDEYPDATLESIGKLLLCHKTSLVSADATQAFEEENFHANLTKLMDAVLLNDLGCIVEFLEERASGQEQVLQELIPFIFG